MKIRAQIGMVLNLDKCIGCHTCSVTCKNVWTNRPGMEYAWFNNVETKPGIGYPKDWENQERWNGGWVRNGNGKIRPKQGGKLALLAKIFANPSLPEIDDYYEPFTFDYEHLHTAPLSKAAPVARPRSLITGQRMEKIEWGPNWEEILGGEFEKRKKDYNFEDVQKDIYGQFENTFMMYLPRLCEHCLNPTCVASCPSGSIYKREEDGIVLIDQDKCRGWRMCVSGCPYKKIYYNWSTGKAEKCIFCYPRIEAGQPTVCSETCVGRIRYLGVLLYDADGIEAAASVADPKDLYHAQLKLFLDLAGELWQRGALVDKVATSFTSSMTEHGGQESTILALNNTLYHWGAIVLPLGYTVHEVFNGGGNPYGTSYTSDHRVDGPDEEALTVARAQGARLARVAATIAAAREAGPLATKATARTRSSNGKRN